VCVVHVVYHDRSLHVTKLAIVLPSPPTGKQLAAGRDGPETNPYPAGPFNMYYGQID
jgi:hypothetical protein